MNQAAPAAPVDPVSTTPVMPEPSATTPTPVATTPEPVVPEEKPMPVVPAPMGEEAAPDAVATPAAMPGTDTTQQ